MALSKCLLNADKQMTPITSLGSLLSIHVKYGWSKKYKRFFFIFTYLMTAEQQNLSKPRWEYTLKNPNS